MVALFRMSGVGFLPQLTQISCKLSTNLLSHQTLSVHLGERNQRRMADESSNEADRVLDQFNKNVAAADAPQIDNAVLAPEYLEYDTTLEVSKPVGECTPR